MANRLKGRYGYPEKDPFRPGTIHRQKLREPSKWRKPRRIFVCSMGDLFHGDVEGSVITDVFHSMSANPQHTYLILTKRPEVMREFFRYYTCAKSDRVFIANWPWPNVWLGVTAENQERADERIPVLLEIPAAVRFVSIEPMLGPVDLGFETSWDHFGGGFAHGPAIQKLDWVIVGGETGPGARPMDPSWALFVRKQCESAGVPFFFKKWGSATPRPSGRVYERVERTRQFPKVI